MLAWLTKSSIDCGVGVGDGAAAVGEERELVAGAVEVEAEALPHPARTITNDAETTVTPGAALKRRRLIHPNCTTVVSCRRLAHLDDAIGVTLRAWARLCQAWCGPYPRYGSSAVPFVTSGSGQAHGIVDNSHTNWSACTRCSVRWVSRSATAMATRKRATIRKTRWATLRRSTRSPSMTRSGCTSRRSGESPSCARSGRSSMHSSATKLRATSSPLP